MSTDKLIEFLDKYNFTDPTISEIVNYINDFPDEEICDSWKKELLSFFSEKDPVLAIELRKILQEL